jgi:hydroxymethylpyrimidine/phosphomethylpyrimidine kinase
VSTSGHELLERSAIGALRQLLLPLTTILTPNVPEAKLLLQDAGITFKEPETVENLISVAKSIQLLGPSYVLVKGGHLPFTIDGKAAKAEEEKELVVDILYGNGIVTRIDTAYQRSKNTHGTGCSLACKLLPCE